MHAFFRSKGSQILKIKPNSKNEDLQEIDIGKSPVAFLTKVVAISDQKCIMIGGASDIKQTKVFPYVFEACSNRSLNRKANMNQPRAAFGCCLSKKHQTIYVVGGSAG